MHGDPFDLTNTWRVDFSTPDEADSTVDIEVLATRFVECASLSRDTCRVGAAGRSSIRIPGRLREM